MTKAFISKLLRNSIVDTNNYRYILREAHDNRGQWLEVQRLPIADLDTTAAIDGWVTIKRLGWRSTLV